MQIPSNSEYLDMVMERERLTAHERDLLAFYMLGALSVETGIATWQSIVNMGVQGIKAEKESARKAVRP